MKPGIETTSLNYSVVCLRGRFGVYARNSREERAAARSYGYYYLKIFIRGIKKIKREARWLPFPIKLSK
ncbi:MAG: hypothetical protein AVDCRST_MAG95-3299 [uncultured Adhaeribacter sp.]|uniref:Uncharacterized protein n=1 Tax=uncultured Adhaeribacter sp. TaxID=448109 RepID=A0A6J4JHZ6_9BACT|nr:MAG: hypothetical protein AVDCRST_MAG95-3299 [uncultured Adhaeribacter sp.]